MYVDLSASCVSNLINRVHSTVVVVAAAAANQSTFTIHSTVFVLFNTCISNFLCFYHTCVYVRYKPYIFFHPLYISPLQPNTTIFKVFRSHRTSKKYAHPTQNMYFYIKWSQNQTHLYTHIYVYLGGSIYFIDVGQTFFGLGWIRSQRKFKYRWKFKTFVWEGGLLEGISIAWVNWPW